MFTKEQMRCVWGADVVSYLSWRHAGEVKREGQYLRLKSDRKVVFHGNSYYDNGTGGHGGPVDALVKYFGYTPVQAIEALTEGVQRAEKPSADGKAEQRYAEMPKPAEGRYSRVYAYLTSVRGIPAEMVNELMRRRLLYQDERGNAVFINPQGDTAEIRGTGSFKPFKSTRRTKSGGMWYYEPKPGRKHVRAYVCESAIDCISLYLLIGDREAVYVSSAGTGNAEAIEIIGLITPVCKERFFEKGAVALSD